MARCAMGAGRTRMEGVETAKIKKLRATIPQILAFFAQNIWNSGTHEGMGLCPFLIS
jgi:hypothetical protein